MAHQNSDRLRISFFFICETYKILRNSMSSIRPAQTKKINHAEMWDGELPTYTVYTLKIDYLGLCTPTAYNTNTSHVL